MSTCRGWHEGNVRVCFAFSVWIRHICIMSARSEWKTRDLWDDEFQLASNAKAFFIALLVIYAISKEDFQVCKAHEDALTVIS